jgi:D-alanyl-D-alanine carboxypeptidase (penicillin-binding protein 5/6)
MAREDVRAYVGTVKSQFPGKMPRAGKARKSYEIYTQDRLLLSYRGAIGVKTGWTTKARGTFVGAAQRGGRTLVATVLHSEGDAWRDSAALLTWGFRNAEVARPVGTLDALQPATDAAAGPSRSEGDVAAGVATGAAAAPSASGGGLPWWLEIMVVVVGVVAVLRARVLLRRRTRRARARTAMARPMPQPRDRADRRRVATAAAAAPTPAPNAASHNDLGQDLRDDEPPATSSASTGTAS